MQKTYLHLVIYTTNNYTAKLFRAMGA